MAICKKLAGEVPLITDADFIGGIDPEPLTDSPLPVEEIIAGAGSSTEPLYLETVDRYSCVHKILPPIGVPDPLASAGIFDPKYLKNPPLYGTPTKIRFDREGLSPLGGIYDPRRDLFYAPDPDGRSWYLLGHPENFSKHVIAAERFAGFLHRIWAKDPLALLCEGTFDFNARADAAEGLLAAGVDPVEEVRKFLAWLEAEDPDLWWDLEGRLGFSTGFVFEATLATELACRSELEKFCYAFTDRKSGDFYLLPRAINLLSRGEYRDVAVLLSHERAHKKIMEEGIVPPSFPLYYAAVARFVSAIVRESPWTGLLFSLFGDFLYARIQCRWLPVLPEEEIKAFTEEVVYAEENGFETTRISEEAHVSLEHLSGWLADYFPAEWADLAWQYLSAPPQITIVSESPSLYEKKP